MIKMTMIVNILLVIFSHFSNDGNLKNVNEYLSQDYSSIYPVFISQAENTTEDFITINTNNQTTGDEFRFNSDISNKTKKTTTTNISSTFLIRLLPFLIDEPPPFHYSLV